MIYTTIHFLGSNLDLNQQVEEKSPEESWILSWPTKKHLGNFRVNLKLGNKQFNQSDH